MCKVPESSEGPDPATTNVAGRALAASGRDSDCSPCTCTSHSRIGPGSIRHKNQLRSKRKRLQHFRLFI